MFCLSTWLVCLSIYSVIMGGVVHNTIIHISIISFTWINKICKFGFGLTFLCFSFILRFYRFLLFQKFDLIISLYIIVNYAKKPL